MKTSVRLIISAFAAAALLLSLCACTPYKKERDAYIDSMNRAFPDDHFSIVNRERGSAKQSDPVMFNVRSQNYHLGFQVWFYKDGTVSDSYYTQYLQKDAEKTITEQLRNASGNSSLECTVNLRYCSIPEITYRKLGSFEELRALRPDYPFLEIALKSDGQTKADKALIDAALTVLQENGYFGKFTPSDDFEWYEVSSSGIQKIRRTGMDGGAFLENEEYIPGEE